MANTKKPKRAPAWPVHSSTVRTINYGLFAFGVDSNGGSFAAKNRKLLNAIRAQGARRKAASHA